MKKIIILTVLIIILGSCSREIECRDADINLYFISLSQSTLDTIIIRKFTQGSNFQSQIDTMLVTSSNAFFNIRGDTSALSLNNPRNKVKSGFDWQIFFPAVNRTLILTEIKKIDKTSKCSSFVSDCFCDDEILNLKVDNQSVVFQDKRTNILYVR